MSEESLAIKEKFDQAGRAAQAELKKRLAKMTPAQLDAIRQVQLWAQETYMSQGLKRIGTTIRDMPI